MGCSELLPALGRQTDKGQRIRVKKSFAGIREKEKKARENVSDSVSVINVHGL